jgi:hypothetical protein
MEGFGTTHKAQSVVVVGHKDVKTVDDAARLLLESFVAVDERQEKVAFKIGSMFQVESAEICRNFSQGRHLAVLSRVVERQYLDSVLPQGVLLILAIDEADKCPVAVARLIRAIATHTQQQGVKGIRFLLAGVSPFYQRMCEEDNGVSRFVYRTSTLEPMTAEEATDLMETKLALVSSEAQTSGIPLATDPSIIPRVVALSGGHPHLLQLLGSYLIEHENGDPDGVIDARDLANSLHRICYEDRAQVYDSTLHRLELEGKLDDLGKLLEATRPNLPTRIDREQATELVSKDAIQWLVEHDVLAIVSDEEYGLVDEFLRVRMLFDQLQSIDEQRGLEGRLIGTASLEDFSEAELGGYEIDEDRTEREDEDTG